MTHQLLIDTSALAAHLQEPGWVLLDCRFDLADTARGEREHAVSHIPGAHYAHMDRDLSDSITPESGRHPLPDPGRLRAWLGRHGIGEGVQVVAYDDSGGSMAVRIWWLLRWMGHTEVAVLDGGWQAWCGDGLPLEYQAPELPGAAELRGEPDDGMLLSTRQVMENLETRQWLLLDARTGERFRGEQEPIDPVAGHIPGSRSHPLQTNLGPDGRFRSAAELHAAYRACIGSHSHDRLACLCGSGVSACHNLLAMELAGFRGVRLYAGSWSEWIRDSQRPVAVGVQQLR